MILSTFSSWDFDNTWLGIIQIGFVCLVLIISNTLRRKIPFLRNMLLPTAVIAGFLGLGLKYLIMWLDIRVGATPILNNEFFEIITYHTIAIGFIALTLKTLKTEGESRTDGTAIKSGLLIVSSYLMQAVIGLVITIALGFLFTSVAQYAGILLPMGFGQGPGQAGNIGQVLQDNGFVGGKSFGLSISTFGFLWACIPGVYYINKLAKQKKITRYTEVEASETLRSEVETKDEIPLTESIDKLSIQLCFVGFVYLVTWLFMQGASNLLVNSGIKFLAKDLNSLLWGFNFIFALIFTMILKRILAFLMKKKIMKRKYTNDYMLNRISGVAFDFMIACSIMAIELEMLNNWGLIIALILVTSIGGFITYHYIQFACKRLYPSYVHEATAGMYGMMTGTASTGVALLREIDPNFKTKAADDLVLGSGTAVMFGGPLLIIAGLVYRDGWYWLYGSLAALFIFFIIIYYFLFLFKHKKKVQATNK
ncbi:MAG: sodium/glutamate symporter [Bacilli bacterium]|jgi:ESS family glutamate:Na+ symporter|nr:sodium/glutamate symporter [Bacilli bacterium]